jgi:hypothetical protein
MDTGRLDYDLPPLTALRVVAGVATLNLPEQKRQKNKRPLFDGIFFRW